MHEMLQKESDGGSTPEIIRFIMQYKHFCRIPSPYVVPAEYLKFYCSAAALVLPERLKN